jgi:hypothetical protein
MSDNLAERVARLESMVEDIAEIKDDVKLLVAGENQRKGAQRAVYSIAAIVSTVSSVAVSAAIKLWPK